VDAAIKMQLRFDSGDIQVPVRIGVHLGEIVYREGNVFGDSVNVASRIESMAVPNSILISKSAQQQLQNKRPYQFLSLGNFHFKNVKEPMEVFALNSPGLNLPNKKEITGKLASKPVKKSTKILIGSLTVLLLALMIWQLANQDNASQKVSYSSLAIFPFQNISGNTNLDYLGEGMAENLIGSISDQTDLKVISRYSTSVLKDSAHNLSFIQKLLNVDMVLVGSFNQSDEALVFNTELISTKSQERLWGDQLRGTEQDLPRIQNQLKQSLLASLGESDKQKTIQSVHPQAYQHYMQGQYLSFGHTQREIDQSIEHFHKAIEIDPDFAASYAGLANQKFAQARFSNTTRQELIREAKLAINTAIKLDPNLPEAMLAEANIKFFCDFDWDGALKSFEKALRLDPDNALINADFAFYQSAMNNYDEALALAEKAISLDPVSISSMHIIAWVNLYYNPQQSIEDFNKVIELHPNWIWGYMKKGMAEILVGDCEAALQSFAEVEGRKGDWGGELLESYLAILYKKCGEDSKSQKQMAFVLEHVESSGIADPLNIALLHGGTGDLDQMMFYAEKCVEQNSVNVALMQLVKDLDFFFNDPFKDSRYAQLLRELEFPNN
jgi:TolB-like protein/Tfp pilus assembly protein PilF